MVKVEEDEPDLGDVIYEVGAIPNTSSSYIDAIGRRQGDFEDVRPGAYAIRGPSYTPVREDGSATHASTNRLPIARLVPATIRTTTPATAQEDTLGPNADRHGGSANARKTRYFLEVVLIGLSSATIGLCIWIFSKSEAFFLPTSIIPTLMPSPRLPSPPTIVSIQPTTERLRIIKQFLIPISGEEILNDPRSIQNFAWNYVGEDDWHSIPLTEPEKIIQRYASTVVGMSILNFYNFEARIIQNNVLFECDIFFCNENGEIVDMVIYNNWNIGSLGTIPKEIGQLTKLKRIVFRNNRSIGSIPTEIGLLTDLTHLDLGLNFMTGSIPTEIGKLESLEWLILSQNKLQNSLPSEIGEMKNLVFGAFSSNSIQGNIPTSINKMENLKGLELQNNHFSGDAEFICDRNYPGVRYNLDVDTRNKLYYGKSDYNLSLVFDVTIDCEKILQCSCCPCI